LVKSYYSELKVFNVVLITIDSLRADHVGCIAGLDGNRTLTPHLDDWARNAFIFSSAVSQSSHTSPSFLAILSGCYPCTYGDWFSSLSRERLTITQILRENGYVTGAFLSNPYISCAFDFDRGFDSFEDNLGSRRAGHIGRKFDLAKLRLTTLFRVPYKPAGHINRQVFDWLEKVENPFFLWVHYMDVHGPYLPEVGFGATQRLRAGYLWRKALSEPEKISSKEKRFLTKTYAQKVKDMDSHLSLLLQRIQRDNTLIVITADHGDLLGEHGLYGHPLELYEELLHVPLIISLPPDSDTTPHRIQNCVQSIDIVPTILDLLGMTDRSHFHGDTLVHLIKGDLDNESDRYIISEVSRSHLTVRKWPWKAIFNFSDNLKELYDIDNDAAEQIDRASQEVAILNEFEQIALSHIDKYRLDHEEGTEEAGVTDDERIKAQLKALGYMD